MDEHEKLLIELRTEQKSMKEDITEIKEHIKDIRGVVPQCVGNTASIRALFWILGASGVLGIAVAVVAKAIGG